MGRAREPQRGAEAQPLEAGVVQQHAAGVHPQALAQLAQHRVEHRRQVEAGDDGAVDLAQRGDVAQAVVELVVELLDAHVGVVLLRDVQPHARQHRAVGRVDPRAGERVGHAAPVGRHERHLGARGALAEGARHGLAHPLAVLRREEVEGAHAGHRLLGVAELGAEVAVPAHQPPLGVGDVEDAREAVDDGVGELGGGTQLGLGGLELVAHAHLEAALDAHLAPGRPPTSAVESDTKNQPLSVCSEARCSRSRATASTMRSLKATQSADTSR